jgi:hypothetical protein
MQPPGRRVSLTSRRAFEEVFMRKAFVITASSLLLSAMAGRPVFAIGDELIRAHIPFPFHVANSALPPGDYVIQSAHGMDRGLLEIRKDDGRAVLLFLTESADPSTRVDNARLVFDQYGQERFLHEILVPGDTGSQLRVSTQETEAALATARAAAGKAVQTEPGD